MNKLYLFASLIWLVSLNANAQETAVIGNYKKLYSDVLGGEVSFIEHLPEGYAGNRNTYPVLYLMNSESMSTFANACATVDNLASERIPDLILIGICNTGVIGKQWACPDDSGQMASAERFNLFLEKELVPEINKNYRTNNFNILAGQSNSSLLVLNNLTHSPGLFSAYVAISPMLGWCPSFQVDEMTRFLQQNRDIRKKLYINYGELDYVEVLDHIQNYSKAIGENAPAGLQWQMEKIGNDGHVPFTSLHNALLFFFSECTLTPALQSGSVADIKSHYEKISKEYGFTVSPKGYVLLITAWDCKQQKKYEKAVELLTYLNGLYPDNALYLAIFGATLLQMGDIPGAREKVNAALAIDPAQPNAKAVLEKLNKVN
jgi:predicted alpha/beta superfamily hydrolase